MIDQNVELLDDFDLSLVNGGSFAYDAGAVIGFIHRTRTHGIGYALVIWELQYSK